MRGHSYGNLAKRRIVTALLAFAFCLGAGGVFMLAAQTPVATTRQIDGTVLDRQGLPVNGATVTVTQKPGTLQKSAQSATGKFKVDGLAPALYVVKVEAV